MLYGLSNPVEAIVAIDTKNGYSKDGQIPWHYPDDFKWFQAATRGCIGLMGRGTYEDINKRLGPKAAKAVLPGRTTFVLSKSITQWETFLIGDNTVPNAYLINHFDEFVDRVKALELFDPARKIVFLGGQEVYELGLPFYDRVHITRIHKDHGCDRFFPFEKLTNNFQLTFCDKREEFTFETYSRVVS